MAEKSRTEIASDNIEDRREHHGLEMNLQKSIHKDDTRQIDELKHSLTSYRKENEKGHEAIQKTLADLSWLAHPDFKNAIVKLVKDEQGKTWLMIKIAMFLKYAGIVIAITASSFGIFWAIFKELRK